MCIRLCFSCGFANPNYINLCNLCNHFTSLNAQELREGHIVGQAGSTTPVLAVRDTGINDIVYSLRVAEHHTYFVGGRDWGFDIWVHNAYDVVEEGGQFFVKSTETGRKLANPTSGELIGYTTREAAQAVATSHNLLEAGLKGLEGVAPNSVHYDPNLVAGPNPNGLRQRAVTSPTAGEGGVYLKPHGGRTKIGSTGDFEGRYGVNAKPGIEVEIPQIRSGPSAGV